VAEGAVKMLVQSLISVIEVASAAPGKRYSGNIQDIEQLLSYENLVKLESSYAGVFAFIAFHPVADKTIADYIRLGSIGGDTGKHVFALFTFDSAAHKPSAIESKTFQKWITIDEGEYPSYVIVKDLFLNGAPPRLPGILFIEKFSEPTEPVFVSLEGQEKVEQVLARFRKLFELATASYLKSQREDDGTFVSHFSAELAKNRMDYKRTNKASMREWLIKAFYKVRDNAGDIVSVVKLFK
jgi:hypothetical protein